MQALATLPKALYLVCSPQKIDSCILVEEEEFQHGEELAASVDSVVAHLRYNIRCLRDDGNVSLDMFASTNIEAMSNICCVMLWPEAHLHMFRKVL